MGRLSRLLLCGRAGSDGSGGRSCCRGHQDRPLLLRLRGDLLSQDPLCRGIRHGRRKLVLSLWRLRKADLRRGLGLRGRHSLPHELLVSGRRHRSLREGNHP